MQNNRKVSIITAVLNKKECIEDCILSVLNQTYPNIEYIIIDGSSTDGTVDIIKKYQDRISTLISESDDGVYYALNKGIKLASGDIIGILHADDFYIHEKAIVTVVSQMTKHNTDSCYSDLLYVNMTNTDKIIRYWKSCAYKDGLFKKGWMPPHPTFFMKKEVYSKYGFFNTDFSIAADYELMLRVLEKRNISTHYIPEVLIKMRVGGLSNRNLKNIVRKTSEDYLAWKSNNLKNSFYPVMLKNLSKIPQFFKRY